MLLEIGGGYVKMRPSRCWCEGCSLGHPRSNCRTAIIVAHEEKYDQAVSKCKPCEKNHRDEMKRQEDDFNKRYPNYIKPKRKNGR